MEIGDLKIGDWVRLIKIPENYSDEAVRGDKELQVVNELFERCLGQILQIEDFDYKHGQVELKANGTAICNEGGSCESDMDFIFVPPDFVELVEGPERQNVQRQQPKSPQP